MAAAAAHSSGPSGVDLLQQQLTPDTRLDWHGQLQLQPAGSASQAGPQQMLRSLQLLEQPEPLQPAWPAAAAPGGQPTSAGMAEVQPAAAAAGAWAQLQFEQHAHAADFSRGIDSSALIDFMQQMQLSAPAAAQMQPGVAGLGGFEAAGALLGGAGSFADGGATNSSSCLLACVSGSAPVIAGFACSASQDLAVVGSGAFAPAGDGGGVSGSHAAAGGALPQEGDAAARCAAV